MREQTINEELGAVSRAVLVGVSTKDTSADEVERGLDELERLLDTAGGECFARVTQAKATLDPRTVIGSGKVVGVRLPTYGCEFDSPRISRDSVYDFCFECHS